MADVAEVLANRYRSSSLLDREGAHLLTRFASGWSFAPPVAGYAGRSPRYRRSELLAWLRRERK